MKQFRIVLAVVLTLGIGGCAVVEKAGEVISVITNPVGLNQEYQVEAAVAVVRRSALAYFQLRQCRRSETASVTNACSRRAVKVQIQVVDRKLQVALVKFRANPTISTGVWAVIGEYKTVLANNQVQ